MNTPSGSQWRWAGLLASFCTALSHAVPLPTPPDSSLVPMYGTSPAIDPTLSGDLIAARSQAFSYLVPTINTFVVHPANFLPVSGTVSNSVVRERASGTLDFYWTISVDASVDTADYAILAVNNLAVHAFQSAQSFDADWRTDLPGTLTGAVVWTPSWDLTVVYFNFDSLGAGQTTRSIFVRTTATDFVASTVDVGTAGFRFDAVNIATFAPSPVPEPASEAMLLAGLVMLAWNRGRKRFGASH